jgi:hypothetical protein
MKEWKTKERPEGYDYLLNLIGSDKEVTVYHQKY